MIQHFILYRDHNAAITEEENDNAKVSKAIRHSLLAEEDDVEYDQSHKPISKDKKLNFSS